MRRDAEEHQRQQHAPESKNRSVLVTCQESRVRTGEEPGHQVTYMPSVEDLQTRTARAMGNRYGNLLHQTRAPSVYISKYNRFADNIIGRINKILSNQFDPVRVKLPTAETKKNGPLKKRNKKRNQPSAKTNQPEVDDRNKMGDFPIARATESEAREPAFVLVSRNSAEPLRIKNTTVETKAVSVASNTKSNIKKKNSGTKQAANKKNPRARATLFGLSSIRRDGDVQVNMQTNHTTVKTNFILGPLTLRVEKEFGKGAKRELKSATATTTEMYGRLNLRIIHGGAATLHSIRVLQPKQVRVESKDNHDKSKEYVWKRSSHIARVVSNKLTKAAKSMLQPPPSN